MSDTGGRAGDDWLVAWPNLRVEENGRRIQEFCFGFLGNANLLWQVHTHAMASRWTGNAVNRKCGGYGRAFGDMINPSWAGPVMPRGRGLRDVILNTQRRGSVVLSSRGKG
jgi:hypothetical protein